MVDATFVLNIFSAIGGLGGLAIIAGVAHWLGGKFREIDYRFKVVDERFNEVDKRFNDVDRRFAELKNYVDMKFSELKEYSDKGFNDVGKKFIELRDYVNAEFGEMDRKWSSRLERLGEAFTGYQEFLLEFLATEGVIEEKYKGVFMKELKGFIRLATANPLSKEEWGRLKELFEKSEKDELTPEEADEFLELARKVVREYWDRREAYRLHIYAAIVRGLTYKKYYEKKETKEEKHQG
uniref:Uncharacterized protein n=1 Tax=Ignisphaera aggregans TaxID=334771 RepID=A0A7J2U680_9CREN